MGAPYRSGWWVIWAARSGRLADQAGIEANRGHVTSGGLFEDVVTSDPDSFAQSGSWCSEKFQHVVADPFGFDECQMMVSSGSDLRPDERNDPVEALGGFVG